MREKLAQLELSKLVQWRNALFLGLVGSLLINLFQAALNLTLIGSHRTVIVPTGFQKEFWVSDSAASPSYLAEMARHVAFLVLNVSPETIDYNQQKLLQLVHPSAYGKLKNQMLSAKQELSDKKITTVIFITEVTADSSKLNAQIVGDLVAYMGETRMPPQRKTYQVRFDYSSGRLTLLGFEEIAPKPGGEGV